MEVNVSNETKKLTSIDLIIQSFKFHGKEVLNEYLRKHRSLHSAEDTLAIALECASSQTQEFPPIIEKFHKFLINRSAYLFEVLEDSHNLPLQNIDAFEPTVPLTEYLQIPNKELMRLFFKSLQQFDVMVCKVTAKEEFFYVLQVLCFAYDKQLVVDNLLYHVYLPIDKIENSVDIGSLVQVSFYGCAIKERKMFVTADIRDIGAKFSIFPKLGPITQEELPVYYKLAKMGVEYDISDSKLLKPHCIRKLLKSFNIDKIPLFSDRHNTNFQPEELASNIKYKQQCDLSNMNYRLGNERAFEGKVADALKYYTLALELNPNNIDALFSQGCLYIKMKNFAKGISKLENVLKLQPSHENAKAYLSAAFITQLSIMSSSQKISSKSEMDECLRIGNKTLKMNKNNDSVIQDFTKCLYNSTRFNLCGTFPNYKMDLNTNERMSSETLSSNDMEVDMPLQNIRARPESSSSSSSSWSHKSKSSKDKVTLNLVQEDLHKLKCDEFINRLKKINISKNKLPESPRVSLKDTSLSGSNKWFKRKRCLVDLSPTKGVPTGPSTSFGRSSADRNVKRPKSRTESKRKRPWRLPLSSRHRSMSPRMRRRCDRSTSGSPKPKHRLTRNESVSNDNTRNWPLENHWKNTHPIQPVIKHSDSSNNSHSFAEFPPAYQVGPSYCNSEKESALEIMKNIFDNSN